MYTHNFGITAEGGCLLVNSGLGLTLAQAYYCARNNLDNKDDVQVVFYTRDAYGSVAVFWNHWRPVIFDMPLTNPDDMVLQEIKEDIDLDRMMDNDFCLVKIWISQLKRFIVKLATGPAGLTTVIVIIVPLRASTIIK